MSRDMATRPSDDLPRINIHEDADVAYWTAKWGVTRAELTDAISKVGARATDVATKLERASA